MNSSNEGLNKLDFFVLASDFLRKGKLNCVELSFFGQLNETRYMMHFNYRRIYIDLNFDFIIKIYLVLMVLAEKKQQCMRPNIF